MTEQPGQRPDERLPVPREPDPVVPPEPGAVVPREPAEVDRFTAHPSAHTAGLTPERAAKIVTQSASARWVAFLAVTIVSLFVIVYYFYDLGVPGVANSSRLANEVAAQQVTAVTQGYALFEANCARCHGAQGQGGIGPTLNDQAKLLTHLTPGYLMSVLTVGGRYVCGDPNSLMPIWSDQGNPPGPLNYRNLQELIAFITAPSTLQFQGVDPTTGQTVTMSGWRDPSYVLPAGATPVPACWKDAFTSASSPAAERGAQRRGSERGALRQPGRLAGRIGRRRGDGPPAGGGEHRLRPDRTWPPRRASRSRSRSPTTTPGSPTTSRSTRARRPARRSSRARSSPAWPPRPTTCRRSPPGRTASSARSTPT